MTDDIDRIMQVMEAAFDPRFGEAWTYHQVADALRFPHCRYLLIAPDGSFPTGAHKVAGFTLSRRVLDEEELLLIAIAPDFRGRGLGHRLLAHFIATARELGVARLFLEMRANNTAAILYRTVGFEPVGRRRHYYRTISGHPIDAITFAMSLASGDDSRTEAGLTARFGQNLK